MHELTIVKNLIDIVTSEVGSSRVRVVRIHVGRGACTSPHALRFCFDVCTKETPLAEATLEIIDTSGDELRVDEVEVD